MSEAPSLADYAEAHKKQTACKICVLPQRAEIDDAYRNGVRRGIIFRWLTDALGLDVPEWALEKHVQRRHASCRAAS